MDIILRRIVPKSKLAIIVFGFIAADILSNKLSYNIIIIFILQIIIYITLLIFNLKIKNKSIKLFYFGWIIFYIYQSLIRFSQSEIPVINENLVLNQDISLYPIKDLRKGYWEARIIINGKKFKGILKLKDRLNENIPDLFCKNGNYHILQPMSSAKWVIFPESKKCHILTLRKNYRNVFRNYIKGLLARGQMTDAPLGVSMGLIFGDTSYLPPSFMKKAKEGGILHLFAASGLHIGILIATIFYLLKWSRISGYYSSRIVPVVLSYLYLDILNFPTSLLRAYFFAFLIAFSSCYFRKINPMDLLIYCGFLIRITMPEEFLSLSFNLSFGAVAGILIIKPIVDFIIWDKNRLVLANFSLSLSASLGTFPFLIFVFNSYSYGSILINLILIPVASITLPVLYSALFFESLSVYFIKDMLWTITEILLRLLLFLTEFLGNLIGFYTDGIQIIFSIVLYCWFIVIIYLLYFSKKYLISHKKKYSEIIKYLYFIIILIISFMFYFSGYYSSKNKIAEDKIILSWNSYIIYSSKLLTVGGNCKYYNYKMKQQINEICKKPIDAIRIDNEECLSLAFNCRLPNDLKTLEFSDAKINEWKGKYNVDFIYKPYVSKYTISKNRYIFFRPGIDKLTDLLRDTKTGSGKIILFLQYRSKDNVENWNLSRKYLGINQNWIFITPNKNEISIL